MAGENAHTQLSGTAIVQTNHAAAGNASTPLTSISWSPGWSTNAHVLGETM